MNGVPFRRSRDAGSGGRDASAGSWNMAQPPNRNIRRLEMTPPEDVLTFQIRRASGADLRTVAELFDGYRQFYGQPADYPLAEAFLRERFTNNDSVVFLAVDPQSGERPGFCPALPVVLVGRRPAHLDSERLVRGSGARERGASAARFWMRPGTTGRRPARSGWSSRPRPRTARPGRCTNRTGTSRKTCSWCTNWSSSRRTMRLPDPARMFAFRDV